MSCSKYAAKTCRSRGQDSVFLLGFFSFFALRHLLSKVLCIDITYYVIMMTLMLLVCLLPTSAYFFSLSHFNFFQRSRKKNYHFCCLFSSLLESFNFFLFSFLMVAVMEAVEHFPWFLQSHSLLLLLCWKNSFF